MDIKHFKTKLEEEKARLDKDFSAPEDLNIVPADKNELADVFEEAANKKAIETELEERLDKIKSALKKIEDGGYGFCEICKNKIEEKRLEANPAAKTCIKHAKQN